MGHLGLHLEVPADGSKPVEQQIKQDGHAMKPVPAVRALLQVLGNVWDMDSFLGDESRPSEPHTAQKDSQNPSLVFFQEVTAKPTRRGCCLTRRRSAFGGAGPSSMLRCLSQ